MIIVLIGCLANFSSGPQLPSKIIGIQADKVIHFLIFLPYPVLVYGALHNLTEKPYGHMIIFATTLLTGCMFAGMIEFFQGLTDYRSAELMDFVADNLGVLTSLILIYI